MLYKQKIKAPISVEPRKKPVYKVINWPEYNKSLKKRRSLSLYFPQGDLETILFNRECYRKGVSEQQVSYKDCYIELIYLFYRLFGWGMRQITGYFEDFWQTKNLSIPTPSFGNLCDLFAALPIKTKQYCDKLGKWIGTANLLS